MQFKLKAFEMKIASVTIARNEENYLPTTIASLHEQTLPPELLVVVNDGSRDGTGKIARNLGCSVIDMPYHEESYVGKPELAKVWNVGLEYVKKTGIDFDYVLLIGAEHLIPEQYIQTITNRMIRQNLVIASGAIKGEKTSERFPWGSGRIVNVQFWKSLNEMKYPVNYGWEDWLVYKAMQLSYKVRCFADIVSETQRPMKYKNKGEIMYALGYWVPYALGRCLLTFFKKPRDGVNMLKGYFFHEGVSQLDVSEWVKQHQKKRLLGWLYEDSYGS